MKEFKLLLLAGDGIGTEIMASTKELLRWLEKNKIARFVCEEALAGGAAYDAHGVSIQDETVKIAKSSDAILFGAVGGEKWKDVPFEHRPEGGLLRLRKDLGLFANIRPAKLYSSLIDASSLKPEYIEGLDIIILRELTGGVYFGEPKEIVTLENGEKRATDNQIYHTHEIERILRFAFELAKKRQNKVTSVEKHNVMKTGVLWKEVATRIHAKEFPDVKLEHMLADNCAMQLVKRPKQFDVIVTDNLFGDILSDQAAMLTGSLGMLPSASLGAVESSGRRRALYEPVHGSAPDIAGRDLANPIAMLSSFSLACRYSFNMSEFADRLDQAINQVLSQNIRTQDIAQKDSKIVGTKAMTQAILKALEL